MNFIKTNSQIKLQEYLVSNSNTPLLISNILVNNLGLSLLDQIIQVSNHYNPNIIIEISSISLFFYALELHYKFILFPSLTPKQQIQISEIVQQKNIIIFKNEDEIIKYFAKII